MKFHPLFKPALQFCISLVLLAAAVVAVLYLLLSLAA